MVFKTFHEMVPTPLVLLIPKLLKTLKNFGNSSFSVRMHDIHWHVPLPKVL